MLSKFKFMDYWILIPYLILLSIGVVMVYSASFDTVMNMGASASSLFKKQLIFAIFGFFMAMFTFLIKDKILVSKVTTKMMLWTTFFMLIFLILMKIFVPGRAINGAVGWINLGPINIQPLEFAKLTLILYFARLLDARKKIFIKKNLRTGNMISAIAQPLIIFVCMVGLVALQPDLGGVLILGFIALIMISGSGIPKKLMALIDGATLSFLVLIYSVLAFGNFPALEKYYQYRRFMSFRNPFLYEDKIGYQLVNSLYAIGNGGFFGVGLGNGIQKRGYLPEPHTDFILAVTSEELGFVGVFVILSLLFILIFRCLQLSSRSNKTYRSLLAFGVAAMLFAQVFLNVGGLLGLIPLTGVTLPFISYGGSSLVILSISIGLILNISAAEKRDKARLKNGMTHV